MFDFKMLHPNILYCENIFDDSSKIIDLIEELDSIPSLYNVITKWEPWQEIENPAFVYGDKKNIAITKFSQINNKDCKYLIDSIKNALFTCYDKYFEEQPSLNKDGYREPYGSFSIKKWNQDMFMLPHTDGYKDNHSISFTMMLYLNDDYEGGEIVFSNQNLIIKPKAGSLLMFPSKDPFTHEVNKSKNGRRLTLTATVHSNDN